MEWSEAVITELRSLWSEGLSTAEIGRRLGISKNAVVGKAHRLSLDPRPSPIRRSAEPSPAAQAGAPTPRPAAPVMAPLPPRPVRPPAVVPVARPVSSGRLSVASSSLGLGRSMACCWPIGEPGTASFRFCGDDAINGKPYCLTHAQLAYVRVRDRREDAA